MLISKRSLICGPVVSVLFACMYVCIFVKQDEKAIFGRMGNAVVLKILVYMLSFHSHASSARRYDGTVNNKACALVPNPCGAY